MTDKIKYDGTCYICGKIMTKTPMKNHLLKDHNIGDEDCFLIKAESPWNKNYWIFFDVPQGRTMLAIDKFLREIWLECCGHLSEFDNVGKSVKLEDLPIGFSCGHEYDFGTTTETKVTIVQKIKRPKQTKARLLARNLPLDLRCGVCGEPATITCAECGWDGGNDLFCEDCYENHEHEDMDLAVVNSPRMGACGYSGELDEYTDSEKWIMKNQALLAKYIKQNA